MNQNKNQPRDYIVEARSGEDVPLDEMSLPEIEFWIKTLTEDKKTLEQMLNEAKENNIKKIVKRTEKALRDINNDLEALTIARIKKGNSARTKLNRTRN